jgi:hypothetical protein
VWSGAWSKKALPWKVCPRSSPRGCSLKGMEGSGLGSSAPCSPQRNLSSRSTQLATISGEDREGVVWFREKVQGG